MEKKERREKLSEKQFELLLQANKSLQDAFKAAQDAQRYLETVSTLILDAKGLPAQLQARLDESSRELVWEEDSSS